MPRKEVNPVVKMLRWFEESPIEALPMGLDLAAEIVRRRQKGETVLTEDGPRIDPPQPKKKKLGRKVVSKPLVETPETVGE